MLRAAGIRKLYGDAVALDCAELAHRAVDRAHQLGRGERARAFLQRTREELVENLQAFEMIQGLSFHLDRGPVDQLERRLQAATLSEY